MASEMGLTNSQPASRPLQVVARGNQYIDDNWYRLVDNMVNLSTGKMKCLEQKWHAIVSRAYSARCDVQAKRSDNNGTEANRFIQTLGLDDCPTRADHVNGLVQKVFAIE
jgi:hypothetical protein